MIIKFYSKNQNNWVEITGIQEGPTFNEELSTALDTCIVKVYSNTKNELSLYTPIKCEIDNTTKYYILSAKNEETCTKITPYNYCCILTLIEPTYYLDKVIMPNQAFTRDESDNTTTMLELINAALLNAEIVYYGFNPRFSLDNTTQEIFSNIKAEDFFFDAPTLRNCLDTMFSVAHRRCTVTMINDFNNIIISSLDLNKKGTLKTLSNYCYFNTLEDTSLSQQSIEMTLTNAINPRGSITHGWDMLKAPDGLTTSDNLSFNVPYEIYELQNVWLKLIAAYQHTLAGETITDWSGNVIVDVSEYFVPSELFNLLTADEQDYHISYDTGSKSIGSLTYKKLFFTHSKISTIVGRLSASDCTFSSSTEDVPASSSLVISPTNPLFKMKYIPYFSLRASLSKNKYPSSTIRDSQTEKNINPIRYGKVLQNKVNQTGNAQLIYDEIITSRNDLLSLGDYISDDYVLSSREFSTYTNYIKVRYIFTQHFNNSVIKSSIDKERKLYNIPLENISRENLLKNYLLFTESAYQDNSFMGEFISYTNRKKLLPNLNGGARTLPEKVYFRTNEMETDLWYLLDIISIPFGTSLIFRFECYDNYSSALGIGEQILGGKRVVYNPYVNTTTGRYENGKIVLATGASSNTLESNYLKYKNLPKAETNYSNENEYLTRTYNLGDVDSIDYSAIIFKTYKDSFIRDVFNLQIEFLSKSNKIYLGENITNTTDELYFYTSWSEEYKPRDTKCLGTRQGVACDYITIIDNSISIGENVLPGHISWAIGTYAGDLIIGVNTLSTIYYELRRNI